MSLLRVQEIEIIGPGKAGVPVGHPYIQLPGMPDPDEIYTGTWENVSADYEGDFFRVEGGDALAFDASNLTEQLDQMQGHSHDAGMSMNSPTATNISEHGIITGEPRGHTVSNSTSAGSDKYAQTSTPISDDTNGTPRTGAETRPVNRTIRIWERIS